VTVSDGHGGTTTSTVSIGVTPVNDLPVTSNVSLTTAEDTPVNGAVTATDDDGDTLAFSVTTAAQHGSVALNADGTFTYTPNGNYNGPDSFVVTVSDGHGGTTTSTVSIGVTPVNDLPVTSNVSLTTAEDTPVNGAVTATDDDGDTLAFSVTTAAQHGSVALNADGTFTYTPNGNYNGPDSFVVTVSDGHGGTTTSTVSIGVTPVNDAPVAPNQALTTAEDTPLSGNVGATDADADALTYAVTTGVAHGSLVLNSATGDFTYTPAPNYNGPDSFVVTVDDGHGGTTTSTISIGVTPVNDLPTPIVTAASGNEDTTVGVTLAASDTDGTVTSFTVTALPANGTLMFNGNPVTVGTVVPATGGVALLTFVPTHDWNGSTQVSFTATDNDGGVSNPGIVPITVTPVNDAPVVGTAAIALSEKALAGGSGGGSASASGTLSITDVDSSSFTVKLAAPSASLTSGGTAITWAVTNGGHTLTGTAGGNTIVTATITDTGAYTVTLSGPIDDSANSNNEAFTLPVSVTDVAGAGSATTLSSMAVSVVDDTPVIGTPASAVLYNGTGVHAEGALNLAIGADSGGAAKVVFAGTQTDASGFIMATRTDNSGVVQGTGYLTFNGSKLTYTQNADGSLSAMAGSTEVYRVKGDLSTGHYTIDTLHTLDPVQINTAVFGSLTAGNNGSYNFSDGSNTFDLTVKAFGGTSPTVNTNNNLMGVNNQFIDTGEKLSFDIAAHGSANPTQVTGMSITANGLGSGETLTWTAYADAAHTIVAGSGTVAGSGSASSNNVDITIDTAKLNAGFNWFSGIEFGASGNNAKYQLALNSITGGSENLHQTTTISAFGRDADGDSSSTSSMSLTFNGNSSITGTGSADALAGGSAADTLVGGAGNDIIVGGAGADSLTGGTGADTFQWRLADKPASGFTTDTITDFNAASTASGGDQLDLRDLLQAEKGSTLDKYLDFQVSGSDTIIHVSSSGGFAAGTAWTAQSGAATATEDQRIVLSNVNLPTALGLPANATDQQIITELLNRGKLVVDNQGG
jgi:T1SS-143 domain-containing protein